MFLRTTANYCDEGPPGREIRGASLPRDLAPSEGSARVEAPELPGSRRVTRPHSVISDVSCPGRAPTGYSSTPAADEAAEGRARSIYIYIYIYTR